ncbi:MAG: bifunctional metallophosphatase/5'-nucleotidase [Syntrophorhabdaceae bacterium]
MNFARPARKFILSSIVFISILLGSAFCFAAELRILYVNDFHGFAESYKRIGSDQLSGGIANLAFRAEQLRKEKPSIFLAAGDMIQGNTWANMFEGKPVIEAMNAMRFDAMVVGNHEFDFGKDVLVQRIGEAGFPVLAANVAGLNLVSPYTIKEVNGIKVGIIGVVTEETPTATHPRNVAGLTFAPVSKTVERYIAELKDKTDIILVLSHIGYNADMILAGMVNGIGVIVGGHSHTKAVKHVMIGNTVIVQAWEHALVLGVLDLTIESGKIVDASSRLEDISPGKIKKDDAVAAIVATYSAKVDASMNRIIGEAVVDLDGDNARSQESNLGNFVADVFRKESGADAVIINGGGLRSSIRKGPITVGNVYSVLPFNNYIIAIRLSGQQIKDALEHGLSGIESKEGRFPQVSGISFTYSPGKASGKRINELLIGGKPVDLAKHYVVATNDFLAAGGDGYQVFREAIRQSPEFEITGGTIKSGNIAYNDAGRWLRDVVVSVITRDVQIETSVEGRIRTKN